MWRAALWMSALWIACAAPQQRTNSLTEAQTNPRPAPDAAVAHAPDKTAPSAAALVIDAQFDAIRRGDMDAATSVFAERMIFNGPERDLVATDRLAALTATYFFAECVSNDSGPNDFPPKDRLRLDGGQDIEGVQWVVERFGYRGKLWVVASLLVDSDGWRILAQSWDVAEPDEVILALARSGRLAPETLSKAQQDPPEDPQVSAWLDQLTSDPTKLTLPPPRRHDSFSVGTAGEYGQSDEALLAIMAGHVEAIEAGQLSIRPMPGRVERSAPDGRAGAAVYHFALTLHRPEGDATIPVRSTIFYIATPTGPRLVGAHYMATP